jgi:hypothetical protein
MTIRDLEISDLPALMAIHQAQGIDYRFPNLTHPLFLVRKVAVDGDRIVGSLVLKLRAEAFLLVEGSPEEKWRAIQELQPAVLQEAWDKGIDEVDCAVPDEIGFQKRLEQMGWTAGRPGWTVFTHETEAQS